MNMSIKKLFIGLLVVGVGLLIASFILLTFCDDVTSNLSSVFSKLFCKAGYLLRKVSLTLLFVDLIIGIGMYFYNKIN